MLCGESVIFDKNKKHEKIVDGLEATTKDKYTLVETSGRYPNGTWMGAEGFERAKGHILSFYNEHKKVPKQEQILGGIISALQKGYYKEFGVSQFGDLIDSCGLEMDRKQRGYWLSDEGFNKAKEETNNFFKEFGRAPRTNEIGTGIRSAIQKGYYEKYGVKTCNEFIESCGYEPVRTQNIWTGEEGLKKAKKYVDDFYAENNRPPTMTEAGSIRPAISRGYYKEFGINSFDEFLEFCGHMGVDTKHQNIWTGKEGFKKAKQEVTEFVKNTNRAPTQREICGGIVAAISRKEYVSFGIESYMDLVELTLKDQLPSIFNTDEIKNMYPQYGEIIKKMVEKGHAFELEDGRYTTNKEFVDKENNEIEGISTRKPRGYWKGTEGLNNAKEEVKKFFDENERAPTNREIDRSIERAIESGYYSDVGIKTYNDFLKYCDLEPPNMRNIWTGEEGFEKAKKYVIDFYAENNRVPNRREMNGSITVAISRGDYKDFGINTFNDLIKSCGYDPARMQNIWTGNAGFEKSKKYILDFCKEHQRTPKAKEIPSGLMSAISLGYYKEQGVQVLSDFIKLCTNSITQEIQLKEQLPEIFYSKERLPEIFSSDDAKNYHYDKDAIDEMLRNKEIFELGNDWYTTDKELVDIFDEPQEKRRNGEKGAYHSASEVLYFTGNAEVELKRVEEKEGGQRNGNKRAQEESQTPIELTDADAKRLRILKASNITPDNAFGYEEKLRDVFENLEEYVEIYRNFLGQKSFHLMKNLIEIKQGSKVLDLGCGVNAPLYEAFKELGIDYTGLDTVGEILELNKKSHPNAKFSKATIPYDLDEIKDTYDEVVASLFFDTLNKPEALLTLLKTNKRMKENGKLTVVLSKARKEEAEFVSNSLRAMGYEINAEKYRLKLKENGKEGIGLFYVIESRKDFNADYGEFEKEIAKYCYLKAKKFEQLKGENIKELSRNLKTMEKSNRPNFYIVNTDRFDNSIKAADELIGKVAGMESVIDKTVENNKVRSSLGNIQEKSFALHIYDELKHNDGKIMIKSGNKTESEENKKIIAWLKTTIPEVSVSTERKKGFDHYTLETIQI